MNKITLLSLFVLLISCGPQKPDYVDESGKEYSIWERCVESHTESKYGYHYGYNFIDGKYNWHIGSYTETICDRTEMDTIEINIDKKYYPHN